jgi:hypothetical protein
MQPTTQRGRIGVEGKCTARASLLSFQRRNAAYAGRKLENFESQMLHIILSNNATKRWLLEMIVGYINGFSNVTEIGNGVTKSGTWECATCFSVKE